MHVRKSVNLSENQFNKKRSKELQPIDSICYTQQIIYIYIYIYIYIIIYIYIYIYI